MCHILYLTKVLERSSYKADELESESFSLPLSVGNANTKDAVSCCCSVIQNKVISFNRKEICIFMIPK